MSTLKVTNIQATGETASRPVSGVSAAWINFNGTTVTSAADLTGVRDSLNFTSLVDDANGEYTLNLSNNMANSNYAYSALNGGSTYTEVLPAAGNFQANPSITTSSYTIIIRSSTTRYDDTFVMSQMHGDLA